MIYVIAIGLALAAFGFYRRIRDVGLSHAGLDTLASAFLGRIAGILIGAGARIGMASIPFFNGADFRFSIEGTVEVILTFSLAGIGLGLIYELFFRKLFRNRGWLFGVVVCAFTGYPVAAAGLQQIQFTPSLLSTIAASASIVAAMFVPYSILLENLLHKWHRFSERRISHTGSITGSVR